MKNMPILLLIDNKEVRRMDARKYLIKKMIYKKFSSYNL